MDKISTAERLCSIVATLGVASILKATLSAKRKLIKVGLDNLLSLSILGRIQRILAGDISWDSVDTEYPSPDWYLNPLTLRVKLISPLPDVLKGIDSKIGSPPLFDKGTFETEEQVIQEVNHICDILEMPLHELINLASFDNNKVYQVLAQELLQRDPTEDFTPKTINFRIVPKNDKGT